jgi:hypothetical protein
MVLASTIAIQPLTVTYSITGTAVLGLDYTLDGPVGEVVIPAGETSATIQLHAYPDVGSTKAKTAKLKLSPGAGYRVPRLNGKAATIKITTARR